MQLRPEWVAAVLVVLAMYLIGCLLVASIEFQQGNYGSVIGAALGVEPPDLAAVLSSLRSLDFFVTKASALYLAYLLTFLGAFYVLLSIKASFYASAGGNSLMTSSPGLVMVSLGVLLVALTLFSTTVVRYSPSGTDSGERREEVFQADVEGE